MFIKKYINIVSRNVLEICVVYDTAKYLMHGTYNNYRITSICRCGRLSAAVYVNQDMTFSK